MTRSLAVTAVAIAAIAALAVAAAASTAAASTTATAAAADPRKCKPYVFLGARGSGEHAPRIEPLDPDVGLYGQGGLGLPLQAEYRTIRDILGVDAPRLLEARYVAYDAIRVKPNNLEAFGMVLSRGRTAVTFAGERAVKYSRSVAQGKARLADEVANIVKYCPKETMIVLAGMSQGAHVAGDVLTALPARLRRRVVAATMFGDPRFNPLASGAGDFDPRRRGLLGARQRYPADVRERVQSWCEFGDPVCQGLTLGLMSDDFYGGLHDAGHELSFAAHSAYPNSATALAAIFAIRQIRTNETANGATPPAPPSPAPRPLDVAFVVDSTGSMTGAIDNVRDNLANIRARLAASASDLRTALVEYRDEPDEDPTFQSRLVTDLTGDADMFAAGVGSLSADGGGDFAESVYSGLGSALDLGWRPDAAKYIVLVGDAPPKDPEPITGLTEDSIVTRALRVPAPIYSLVVGDDYDGADERTETSFSSLSTRTAGQSYGIETPTLVADAILAAIDHRASSPVVRVATGGGPSPGAARAAQASGPPASAGAPVRFSAADSSSPVGERLTFTWDFGDGTVLTTHDTVVAHTWSAPFAGDVRLSVADESGRTADVLHPLTVGAAVPAPGRQPRPRARLRKRKLVLAWKAPRRGNPTYYELRSKGRLYATLGASARRRKMRVTLPRRRLSGRVLRFKVAAYDASGRRAVSRASKRVVLRKAKRRGHGKRPHRRADRRRAAR